MNLGLMLGNLAGNYNKGKKDYEDDRLREAKANDAENAANSYIPARKFWADVLGIDPNDSSLDYLGDAMVAVKDSNNFSAAAKDKTDIKATNTKLPKEVDLLVAKKGTEEALGRKYDAEAGDENASKDLKVQEYNSAPDLAAAMKMNDPSLTDEELAPFKGIKLSAKLLDTLGRMMESGSKVRTENYMRPLEGKKVEAEADASTAQAENYRASATKSGEETNTIIATRDGEVKKVGTEADAASALAADRRASANQTTALTPAKVAAEEALANDRNSSAESKSGDKVDPRKDARTTLKELRTNYETEYGKNAIVRKSQKYPTFEKYAQDRGYDIAKLAAGNEDLLAGMDDGGEDQGDEVAVTIKLIDSGKVDAAIDNFVRDPEAGNHQIDKTWDWFMSNAENFWKSLGPARYTKFADALKARVKKSHPKWSPPAYPHQNK